MRLSIDWRIMQLLDSFAFVNVDELVLMITDLMITLELRKWDIELEPYSTKRIWGSVVESKQLEKAIS